MLKCYLNIEKIWTNIKTKILLSFHLFKHLLKTHWKIGENNRLFFFDHHTGQITTHHSLFTSENLHLYLYDISEIQIYLVFYQKFSNRNNSVIGVIIKSGDNRLIEKSKQSITWDRLLIKTTDSSKSSIYQVVD